MTAITAGHESPQRKVQVNILVGRSIGIALQTVLYLFIRLQGDKPFMPSRAQANLPVIRFNVSGIQHLVEQVGHTLISDFALAVSREVGKGFKEALNLNLQLEAARRIAFQGFLNDAGVRFIPYQYFAVAGGLLVALDHGSLKHPITILEAGFHTVERLF